MARKKRRSRRRKGGQGQGSNKELLKILEGTRKTSKILARAKSIRRRMDQAQLSAAKDLPKQEGQTGPRYESRGQNNDDGEYMIPHGDQELGFKTDPNIGKRKWYDPRGWMGMGGKRRRRRRTRGRRRSRRRRRRRTRKRHRRRRRR